MYTKTNISNSERVRSLKELLEKKKFLRIIEVHNGLSSLIAGNISITKNSAE